MYAIRSYYASRVPRLMVTQRLYVESALPAMRDLEPETAEARDRG